tara:strand:+ start:77 stop:181 length:105 start_codon:yes stop_codon:yes gene_type:complete
MIKSDLNTKFRIYWVLLGGDGANKSELILINLGD